MYENVTHETILNRMLGRVSNSLDKREGSVIFDTHSPTAIEFQVLYIELDTIIRNTYGDTASREFLIRRAKERGITPYPAVKAILKGVFSPVNIDVTGKRFNIDNLNFTVGRKIADGEYQVECETPGTVGNQHLGTMIPIEYIFGLERAELTEILIPGEDEEDTEDLRVRYFESFNDMAFGGNVKDYQNKVGAIPGVGAVKVKRVWNGDLNPAQMIPNDAVKTWYNSTFPSLQKEPAAWLKAVYTAAEEKKLTVGGTVRLILLDASYNEASKTLLETVQTKMDPEQNAGDGIGLAPIGHVVSVVSAQGIKITVQTKIVFEVGYSWGNLQTSIRQAVEEYLLSLRKEWYRTEQTIVRIAQIENHIIGITGIIDISETTINGKPANLVLGTEEVPVLGEVTNI